MHRRNLFLGAFSLATLGWAPTGVAQVGNLADAINKAGRQRMLSQRMGKAYLAQVHNLDLSLARDVMDRSMALFDRQLVELRAFAPTKEVKDTYVLLESEWSRYKSALVGTAPSKSGVEEMVAASGKVLALANQGTVQYETIYAKPTGKLVNIAGRQRMLSQRMVMYYYYSTLPFDVAASKLTLATARQEFVAAMSSMSSAPESTTRIKEELALADAQWAFLEASLTRAQAQVGQASPKAMSDVFLASENLLTVMDKVTGMYSALKT